MAQGQCSAGTVHRHNLIPFLMQGSALPRVTFTLASQFVQIACDEQRYDRVRQLRAYSAGPYASAGSAVLHSALAHKRAACSTEHTICLLAAYLEDRQRVRKCRQAHAYVWSAI